VAARDGKVLHVHRAARRYLLLNLELGAVVTEDGRVDVVGPLGFFGIEGVGRALVDAPCLWARI